MASNGKDDVVIVKVENGRVIKRKNSTGGTTSQSQPRKKRKSLASQSKPTEDVLLIDSDTDGTRKINVSDNENTSVNLNDNTVDVIGSVAEPIGVEDYTSTEDVALIEQQMLDHAVALSLEQEEMEKLARSDISNDREYPTSNNTSSLSRVSPLWTSKLTTQSATNIETTSSLPTTDQNEEFSDKEFELPIYWQPMPADCPKNYELFMVLPGTEEYNMVTQPFLNQPRLTVYSVKRVQNMEFLKRYCLEKKLILSLRGKDFNLNEQRLLHTSAANPDDICEQGLDNRLSRSGGSFGAGIYFRYFSKYFTVHY